MKKQKCPMCGKRKWKYRSAPFERNFLQKIIKYFTSSVVANSHDYEYWRECYRCGYREYPPIG